MNREETNIENTVLKIPINTENNTQFQKILSCLLINRVTNNLIVSYLDLISNLCEGNDHGYSRGKSEVYGESLQSFIVRKLAGEIHTLLKEIHTISGIPSRFEHIDRHYYKAAIELLEKEGKVKTYGSVVQLVPTLEDRKKLLIERINKGKLSLIENLESTLDYYDRGDNL